MVAGDRNHHPTTTSAPDSYHSFWVVVQQGRTAPDFRRAVQSTALEI
jgi:hypothetical protein